MKINKQINFIEDFKSEKEKEMDDKIVGYYTQDKWRHKEHPMFDPKKAKKADRSIDFSYIHSSYLKKELKLFSLTMIETGRIDCTVFFHSVCPKIKPLITFINQFHPDLESLMDIDVESFFNQYVSFIEFHYNAPTIRKVDRSKTPWKKDTQRNNEYLSRFQSIYNFLEDFYDEREETEKDIWDVRKLGIDYNHSKSSYTLNFSNVPINKRPLVKKYLKSRLVVYQNLTWGTANIYLSKLQYFFTFLGEKHPSWTDLKDLKRDDIEDFISFLRKTKTKKNNDFVEPSQNHISRTLSVIETYIGDIQRFDWEEAPLKPITSLIIPGDKPKTKETKSDDIKYIPDDIWEQVMTNLDKLPKNMQLLAILMEATGFRVTDTTALKSDCLVEKEDGFWIKGDQRKVKEKGHRVPVSQEIASLVKKQQEYLKTLDNKITKNNFLIPMENGPRIGEPVLPSYFAEKMNILAHECQIKNNKGEIYWFKNHSFRHRYGVNLINNGMNILHVQKLMAHTSPEMTLTYAQINDNTLRTEWEKAKNNGAVMLDISGNVVEADLEKQAEENGIELEWIRHNLDSIRLDHGFCIKSPKVACGFLDQVLEPPCIKNNCKSFHVDNTFVDYYTEQINKMEADLKIYEQTGRTRSIEIITPKINRYKEIRDGIIKNGGIYGLPKEKREEKG